MAGPSARKRKPSEAAVNAVREAERRRATPSIGAYFGKTPSATIAAMPQPGKPAGQGASTWRKPLDTDSKTGDIDDRRKQRTGPRRPTGRPPRGVARPR